jgi:hypothetical protein
MSGDANLPPPRDGDPEDVAWALSTAEALWKRGEYVDAVAWVRKAATAASEAEEDLRVVELAKAAADLSAVVDRMSLFGPEAGPAAGAGRVNTESGFEIDVEVAHDPEPEPPAHATPKGVSHAGSIRRMASSRLPTPVAVPKPSRPPQRPTPSGRISTPPPAPSPKLPTPNPVPSPLRAVEVATLGAAAAIEEPNVPPPSAPQPPSSAPDLDSLKAVPTVPPEPPDFAPSPGAMRAAGSALRSQPTRPERGKVHPLSETGERWIAERAPVPDRTATHPFGVPMLDPRAIGAPRVPSEYSPVADSEETLQFLPAIEVPPRPGVPSPLPPRPGSEPPPPLTLEGIPAAPPRKPSAPTPPLGSIPPMKKGSLAPSAPPPSDDEGVQKHVSDAPPRATHGPSVPGIPGPPRAPTFGAPPRRPVAGGAMTREVKEVKEVKEKAPRLPTLVGFPTSAPPAAPALGNTPSTRAILLDPEIFEGLADVPDDAREHLVEISERVALLPEETHAAPAMVIVLQGEVDVRAPGFVTRLDAIGAGQVRLLAPLAPSTGEIELVAGAKGARFLALGTEALEGLRNTAPWVVQELEPASDDVHVVAGALRGRHGRRLDGGILDAILARAKTMRLAPGATVVKEGEPVRALILLGSGELTIRAGAGRDAPTIATSEPGDILFATELLGRLPAPATVRAGDHGALVIVATRGATEELLVTVPPLVEILGED